MALSALALATVVTPSATTDASASRSLAQYGRSVYVSKIRHAANPDRAFGRLRPYAQKAVREYLRPVKRAPAEPTGCYPRGHSCPTATAHRSASANPNEWCWYYTEGVSGKGVLGNTLWDYSSRADVCEDVTTSQITAASLSHWGETHFLFWTYDPSSTSELGGAGSDFYQTFSQGKFQFCVVAKDIGCVSNANPWVRQWNGTHAPYHTVEWGG